MTLSTFFPINHYRLLLFRDCGWREDMGEYLTSQLFLPGQILTLYSLVEEVLDYYADRPVRC